MDLFTEKQQDKVMFIECPSIIEHKETEAFQAKQKSWLLAPVNVYAFNFSDTISMQSSFYRSFLVFKQSIKSSEKSVVSFNMKENLKKQITSNGLENSFNMVENIDNELAKLGQKNKPTPKKALDVKFINPFLEATIETLTIQANTKATPKKFHLKNPEQDFDIGIAGIISLVTPSFTGSISLCFPTKVFLSIYNNMFDEDHQEIDAETEDAAGELLNIIYGSAKAKLTDVEGYNLEKAIPTVLAGEKLSVKQTSNGPVFILPFATESGDFHIEIEFNQKN